MKVRVTMTDQCKMSAVILCGGKSRRVGMDKAMRNLLRELDVVYVKAQELTDGVRKSTSCNTP